MSALRQDLRAIAAREMAQDSAHDLAHLDRVWANAGAIAAAEGGADMDVLCAATYLHDLVNLPKDSPDRAQASRLAAQAAAPYLEALGMGLGQIAAAQHAIEAHSFSAGIPPETPEAAILRDADRLDALGAIGIARAFAVSGALGRSIHAPDDPFATARALDDSTFAIDHFAAKLLRLPDGMLTVTGRAIAQTRAATMRRFLGELAGEIGAAPPDHWPGA
ncbi:HD domain-containing protein [Lacimonas salitolerans]|uniref:HD domain-containing protein n=1 Tax=Lacimonas salitolerans TaxID=1323750 RepID=A0ABW4ELN4_9RHOB